MLVLEEYEHAKKRGANILCEIVGYGASADAYHLTQPAPEGEGGQRSMRMALQDAGLVPPLIARVRNGLVYGYVAGTALRPAQLDDAQLGALIARKLARWHRMDAVPGSRAPRLFRTLRRWLRTLPPSPSAHGHALLDRALLQRELGALEQRAALLDCPVAFCHNDLLAGNIIHDAAAGDVHFIDYEYGAYNYRSFDIANHFCEWAGFACDYARFPTPIVQARWLRIYLAALHDGRPPSPDDLQRALDEVALFTAAAHFFWGLWALVQAAISDIDFDYMGYAILRFQQYHRLQQQ